MTEPRDVRPGTPAPSERDCERQGEVVDFSGQRVGSGPCVDRAGERLTHTAYVSPFRPNKVLRYSIAGAVVVAIGLVGIFFVAPAARRDGPGTPLRTVLAPGPTSGPHSMTTTDCAQCHRGAHNVEDARCERCHDPTISARLSNAAHVFQARGDLRVALNAPTVACVTCHVEHRGANLELTEVDDRECGSCHRVEPGARTRLTTLETHPEFAIIRAGVESGSGLKWFSHADHLRKVDERAKVDPKAVGGCESCHQRAPKAPAFEPISFEKHCKTCHEPDISSASAGTFAAALAPAFGALPAGIAIEDDLIQSGKRAITGLTHADPWVLQSVQSFRRVVNPGGYAADRLALDRQVAQLELARSTQGGSGGAWIDNAERDRTKRLLTATGTAIDPTQAASDLDAAMTAAFQQEWKTAPDGTAPSTSAAAAAGADNRREALRQMIDATIARARAAGNTDLESRASQLRQRLGNDKAEDRTPGAETAAAIGLDILINEISKVRDPASRDERSELTELARLAARKAAGGVDPTAFDQHRQRTLMLLAEVRKSLELQASAGDPRAASLQARAASLRNLILATSYSLTSEESATLDRFFRARHADRARIDLELSAGGLRVGQAAGTAAAREAEDRLPYLSARLDSFAVGTSVSQVSLSDARAAITALLGRVETDPAANTARKSRCTMCHDLTAAGDQLAPIRTAGESLMPSARFTHEHHVTDAQPNCETCHANIRTSVRASDVNLPNIASCRTCHAPEQTARRATGCESCHTYHVPRSRALLWQP